MVMGLWVAAERWRFIAAFGTAKRVPFGPAAVSAGLNGSHLR